MCWQLWPKEEDAHMVIVDQKRQRRRCAWQPWDKRRQKKRYMWQPMQLWKKDEYIMSWKQDEVETRVTYWDRRHL